MLAQLLEIDHALTRKIASQSRRYERFFTIISYCAIPEVILCISALMAIVGTLIHNFELLNAGCIALITVAASSVLKRVFKRIRPDTSYTKSMRTQTFSFPSGHSAGAATLLGVWCALLSEYVSSQIGVIALWGTAMCMVAVVGYSRVYLGAHYASDVIAGWLLGVFGVILYIVI